MLTILLIDDDENFRELLKVKLAKSLSNKVAFIEASNPLMALELFNRNIDKVDIVLCDYFLPIQNGNDFLEIIKKGNSHIKCLLISADDQIQKDKPSYADGVFSKLDLEDLFDFIKKKLNTWS